MFPVRSRSDRGHDEGGAAHGHLTIRCVRRRGHGHFFCGVRRCGDSGIRSEPGTPGKILTNMACVTAMIVLFRRLSHGARRRESDPVTARRGGAGSLGRLARVVRLHSTDSGTLVPLSLRARRTRGDVRLRCHRAGRPAHGTCWRRLRPEICAAGSLRSAGHPRPQHDGHRRQDPHEVRRGGPQWWAAYHYELVFTDVPDPGRPAAHVRPRATRHIGDDRAHRSPHRRQPRLSGGGRSGDVCSTRSWPDYGALTHQASTT